MTWAGATGPDDPDNASRETTPTYRIIVLSSVRCNLSTPSPLYVGLLKAQGCGLFFQQSISGPIAGHHPYWGSIFTVALFNALTEHLTCVVG